MGKALILKDVDFSGVALDKVEIYDRIPCTGISLNQSAITVTTLNTVTLTATFTPANTTDAVVWSSSDESVCSVENGVITPIKSGTATITATCGNHSASCEITADITIVLDAHMTSGYIAFMSSETYVTINSNGTCGLSLITDRTGRRAYDPNKVLPSGMYAYPIILPDNASELVVTVPLATIKVSAQWVDINQSSPAFANCALRVGGDSSAWASSIPNGNRTMEVPEGANGVYITCYKDGITQEDLDSVTVTARL